jgi:hypothetical protein
MIADTRAAVAAVAAGVAEVAEVFDYVPDDVAALPCVVVTGPAGDPSAGDLAGIAYDVDVEVLVIGRRYGDADASAQLDRTTDDVIDAYVAASDVRLRRWRSEVVDVAGVDVPAYRLYVSLTTLSPCP